MRGVASHSKSPEIVGTIPTSIVYDKIVGLLRSSLPKSEGDELGIPPWGPDQRAAQPPKFARSLSEYSPVLAHGPWISLGSGLVGQPGPRAHCPP